MVGLSVVLEAQKSCINKKTPQVINKTTMLMLSSIHNKPSPQPSSLFQPPTFLDQCFLCGKRLLPGKDIYMYKWVSPFINKYYIYIYIYNTLLSLLFFLFLSYSIACVIHETNTAFVVVVLVYVFSYYFFFTLSSDRSCNV